MALVGNISGSAQQTEHGSPDWTVGITGSLIVASPDTTADSIGVAISPTGFPEYGESHGFGPDVVLYVSGWEGGKIGGGGAGYGVPKSTAVIGGDLVVSGVLYGGAVGAPFGGSSNDPANVLHIADNVVLHGSVLNMAQSNFGTSGNYLRCNSGVWSLGSSHHPLAGGEFQPEFEILTGSVLTEGQVLFLSGGGDSNPHAPDETQYTDINFFVSGSANSKGDTSTTRGVSCFAGDMVTSGAIYFEEMGEPGQPLEPSAPPVGTVALYAKADGGDTKIFYRNAAEIIGPLGTGGGGGGGDIDIEGDPVAGQLAFWTDVDALGGSSDVTVTEGGSLDINHSIRHLGNLSSSIYFDTDKIQFYGQGPTSFDEVCTLTLGGDAHIVTHPSNPLIRPGMMISGDGVVVGAHIVSVTDATHFVMSADASASGAPTITFKGNVQKLLELNPGAVGTHDLAIGFNHGGEHGNSDLGHTWIGPHPTVDFAVFNGDGLVGTGIYLSSSAGRGGIAEGQVIKKLYLSASVVLINSGAWSSDAAQVGVDTTFFVSGNVGGAQYRDSGDRGVSVFGGDVFHSGAVLIAPCIPDNALVEVGLGGVSNPISGFDHDTSLFVSGTWGSSIYHRDGRRGTVVFGGDLIVSGIIGGGSPAEEHSPFAQDLASNDTSGPFLIITGSNIEITTWDNAGQHPDDFTARATLTPTDATLLEYDTDIFVLTDTAGNAVTFIFDKDVVTVDGSLDSGKVIVGLSGASTVALICARLVAVINVVTSFSNGLTLQITASDSTTHVLLIQDTAGLAGERAVNTSGASNLDSSNFACPYIHDRDARQGGMLYMNSSSAAAHYGMTTEWTKEVSLGIPDSLAQSAGYTSADDTQRYMSRLLFSSMSMEYPGYGGGTEQHVEHSFKLSVNNDAGIGQYNHDATSTSEGGHAFVRGEGQYYGPGEAWGTVVCSGSTDVHLGAPMINIGRGVTWGQTSRTFTPETIVSGSYAQNTITVGVVADAIDGGEFTLTDAYGHFGENIDANGVRLANRSATFKFDKYAYHGSTDGHAFSAMAALEFTNPSADPTVDTVFAIEAMAGGVDQSGNAATITTTYVFKNDENTTDGSTVDDDPEEAYIVGINIGTHDHADTDWATALAATINAVSSTNKLVAWISTDNFPDATFVGLMQTVGGTDGNGADDINVGSITNLQVPSGVPNFPGGLAQWENWNFGSDDIQVGISSANPPDDELFASSAQVAIAIAAAVNGVDTSTRQSPGQTLALRATVEASTTVRLTQELPGSEGDTSITTNGTTNLTLGQSGEFLGGYTAKHRRVTFNSGSGGIDRLGYPGINTDTSFYVSGSIEGKDNDGGGPSSGGPGVSVFGGDLVVSGNLYINDEDGGVTEVSAATIYTKSMRFKVGALTEDEVDFPGDIHTDAGQFITVLPKTDVAVGSTIAVDADWLTGMEAGGLWQAPRNVYLTKICASGKLRDSTNMYAIDVNVYKGTPVHGVIWSTAVNITKIGTARLTHTDTTSTTELTDNYVWTINANMPWGNNSVSAGDTIMIGFAPIGGNSTANSYISVTLEFMG